MNLLNWLSQRNVFVIEFYRYFNECEKYLFDKTFLIINLVFLSSVRD